MGDKPQLPVPPVVAAMASADAAASAHKLLADRLVTAIAEAERRDDLLRRTQPEDTPKLLEAAKAYGNSVALVQQLSDRVEQARSALVRAQETLALTRRASSHARVEQLRVELEIDAAAIWDLVGRFEEELRTRLDQHGRIASEMQFFATAAGERALPSTPWTPALGATGEALWHGIARGAAELQHRLHAPAAHPALKAPDPLDAALSRAAEPEPDRAAASAEPIVPYLPPRPPRRMDESPRQRLARILRDEKGKK